MSSYNIIILGWFDKNNLGDNLYFQIYEKLLTPKYNILLVNPENIKSIPSIANLILIGGGDLMNDYFMNKINPLIENLTIPVYAFSVGFPYEELETLEYIKNIDYVFSRNISKINSYKINYIPDLATLLPKLFPEKRRRRFSEFSNLSGFSTRKTIGVFLAQPFFVNTPELLQSYCNLIENLLITNCCEKRPLIKLYSFNTQIESDIECDNIPNYTILDKFGEDVEMVTEKLSAENIQGHFYNLDLAICGRFHSVVLSIITNTPFLAISPTRKVKLLLQENNLTDYLIVPKRSFNVQKAVKICKELLKTPIDLEFIYKNWEKYNVDLQLINLIESGFTQVSKQILPKADLILKRVKNNLDFNPEFTAQAISFTLTNKIDSCYNWGIADQIKNKTYNLIESIKYILEKEYNEDKNKFNFNKPNYSPVNMNYFDKDHTKGLHRSGWSPVVERLKEMSGEKGIAFDAYSDKTFGWKRDFYAEIGFLPIKKKWIGVFHHTSSAEAVKYSKYNLVSYFNDKLLIDSLDYCKFILVLSTESKNWIKNRLKELNKKVEVISMFHPTETLCMRFNTKSFFYNQSKSVVQVGAWLRDTYAIFDLPLLKFLNKIALKGKLMENYYYNNEETEESAYCISRGENKNKYYEGLINSIKSKKESVKVIEYINNDEYDYLLTRNIVFLKLVDCAGVNTVLECIIRNTPIVINRLPALEEYLGKDYPLFYNNQSEAIEKLNSLYLLSKGHSYLKKMDKTRFSYDYFIEELKCYL